MSLRKRRIEIEDLYRMKFASDPQISPDGALIAFVIKKVNLDDDTKYTSDIFMVKTDGSERPYQFTNIGTGAANPRFSPDGKYLAFTAKEKEYTQIYLQPVQGGAALPLTSGDYNAGAPEFSPDGKKILFAAKVFPKDYVKKDTDVKYITTLRYKLNGVGFLDDRVSQIHVVDLKTRETTQVTDGEYACLNPSWSPCSERIVFHSNRTEDAEYNSFSDIYTTDLRGRTKKITKSDGAYSNAVYSPDGEYLAYVGHRFEYSTATIPKVYLEAVNRREKRRVLTEDFGTAPNHAVSGDLVSSPNPGLLWSADSKTLFFVASKGGRSAVYRLDLDQKPKQLTWGDEVIYGHNYCPATDQFAILVSTMTNICELYVLNSDGTRKQLSNCNGELLSELDLPTPEQFIYRAEGFDIEGWIMKPVDFKPKKKYPTILHIHGGPHVAYGHNFFHEFHLLAAAGYAVVFTNPPGSTNYGQEFIIQTHHAWGKTDYRALMAATDYVNAKYDFVDPNRWGVTGGSYGGYMTNWMITQTDFFKAAVSARSTCNRYSQFGTSDVGFFNGIFEQKGNPWDNPEFYQEVSPITYVNNVKTPVLLIHAEQDHRCPISQSEEFYTALKWLKKEVAFARFPNENHELSRAGQPRHRKERLQMILDWFKRYLPA